MALEFGGKAALALIADAAGDLGNGLVRFTELGRGGLHPVFADVGVAFIAILNAMRCLSVGAEKK